MSGTEGVDHFLEVPQIITKSMDYHYPAEFIVPTNVPFDIGPLGRAYETEFSTQEVAVGLRLEDLYHGFLTLGGTPDQRFSTNLKIAYETAIAEGNYLILTTNPEWSRLLDLLPEACLIRLGKDFTLNPLDPEGTDPNEYASILAQAFAQAFYLSRLGTEALLESFITLLGESQPDLDLLVQNLDNKVSEQRNPAGRELATVLQFLQNIGHGEISTTLGPTNIPFRKLLSGVTIVEIDLKGQQQVQFLLLCLLAKLLAHKHTHPDAPCTVLLDSGDVLAPLDSYTSKMRDMEHYGLDWFRRFRASHVGLHLSINNPSRFPAIFLNFFRTFLVHRITAYEDIKLVRDLLQFLPDQVVHTKELRHDNYEVEFLKGLPPSMIFLKRADIPNAFPVQLTPANLAATHLWTAEELESRLHATFPDWAPPTPEAQTTLDRDFHRDVPAVQKILSLLSEYPDLGTQGILSALQSSPGIDLDMPALERLLNRLVSLNYIAPNEWEDGHGHRHQSYQLKDKGQRVYQEFLDESQPH